MGHSSSKKEAVCASDAYTKLKQLRDMLKVASDSRFHVGGQSPEVVASFGKGEVSLSLKAALQRMGVQIEIRSQGVLP